MKARLKWYSLILLFAQRHNLSVFNLRRMVTAIRKTSSFIFHLVELIFSICEVYITKFSSLTDFLTTECQALRPLLNLMGSRLWSMELTSHTSRLKLFRKILKSMVSSAVSDPCRSIFSHTCRLFQFSQLDINISFSSNRRCCIPFY